MNKIELTGVGADVELFVQDRTTNEIVSAEGYVRGTKKRPYVFDKSNKFFATTLDNVLAEFSIPPVNNKEEFLAYLNKGRNYLDKTLSRNNLCTIATPAATLDPKYLQTKNAKLFGCEKDYNAYSCDVNVSPSAADICLRSAGGHIHLGYLQALDFDKDLYTVDGQRSIITKAMDLFVGVPSVILEPYSKRKELYGKAGAFRPKTYGLEYRTVSNYYLATPELIKWVYEATINAINWLNAGNIIDKELSDYIQKTINSSNKENAEILINEFKLAA